MKEDDENLADYWQDVARVHGRTATLPKPDDYVWVGLIGDGKEIEAPGYARVPCLMTDIHDGSTITPRAIFGPLLAPRKVTEVALWKQLVGGEMYHKIQNSFQPILIDDTSTLRINDGVDDGKIQEAKALAITAHGNQKYGGYSYLVHLTEVAHLVSSIGEEARIVAFLHDSVEDTELAYADIKAGFGFTVAECVEVMSDPKIPLRKERKKVSYARLGAVDKNSPLALALIVKAADRLANIRSTGRTSRTFEEGASLKAMYHGEQAQFREAVYRKGLNDAYFDEIERLLAVTRGVSRIVVNPVSNAP